MGLEKIKFEYIKTQGVLVGRGLGDLLGIVVQSNTVQGLRQEIIDVFTGYMEIFPKSMKKITIKEWREKYNSS